MVEIPPDAERRPVEGVHLGGGDLGRRAQQARLDRPGEGHLVVHLRLLPRLAVQPGAVDRQWRADGRALYLGRQARGGRFRIDEVDLATGRRAPWKELRTADPAGAW